MWKELSRVKQNQAFFGPAHQTEDEEEAQELKLDITNSGWQKSAPQQKYLENLEFLPRHILEEKSNLDELQELPNLLNEKIIMLCCVTMYNESSDALLRTLTGIQSNLPEFERMGITSDRIVVVVL